MRRRARGSAARNRSPATANTSTSTRVDRDQHDERRVDAESFERGACTDERGRPEDRGPGDHERVELGAQRPRGSQLDDRVERRVHDAVRETGDDEGDDEQRRARVNEQKPERKPHSDLPHAREQDPVDRADEPKRDHSAGDGAEPEAGERQTDDLRLARRTARGRGPATRRRARATSRRRRSRRSTTGAAADRARGSGTRRGNACSFGASGSETKPGAWTSVKVSRKPTANVAASISSTSVAPNTPISTPAIGGPSSGREPVRRLEQRVRLAEPRLVLTDQVGQQRRLRRERRRREDADAEDEHEQQREAERVGHVQQRDRRHQRRAGAVADQASCAGTEPRREPSAKPPSATAAASTASTSVMRVAEPDVVEHEPRQRDPGHLRTGERDDLAREDSHQPGVAEEVPLAHAGAGSGSGSICRRVGLKTAVSVTAR